MIFSNPPQEIYLGVKRGILTPHFWKEIFSDTHSHGIYIIIIILYSETRSITDLWTPQNVGLMILTPPVKK